MDRARPHAARIRCRRRDRVFHRAFGTAARLHARRLCAAARHRAPSRRIFRRHARDGGTDRARRRALRSDQFRDAARTDGKACAAGFLDLVARHPGGVEPRLSGRRPLQSLCRPRASHLRGGAVGLSRRTSRDGGRGAALSPVRAVRLGVLSARRRLALWSLWHARHRASGPAYSLRACRMAGGRADDRRAAGEDGAFPIAFVAAPGARQRARRGQRRAFRAGGQRAPSSSLSGSGSMCSRLFRA